MRLVWGVMVFLLALVCTSMTQCPKCIKGDLKVDTDAKNWIPYMGKDSVSFITSNGSITKYMCTYGDSTRSFYNYNCGDYYNADSVGASLEISVPDSLFILLYLSSPNQLCLGARTRDSAFVSTCRMIDGPVSPTRTSYQSLVLNNITYTDVRLANTYPGLGGRVDSIYIAKNYGVISFKYNNTKYYLKQ